MATGKRYYWIKLRESFMGSDEVDYLMSLPNGANYVVLYQMLCLETINTEGKLARQIGEITIPYDVNKIQRDCKWFSASTIKTALDLYRSFGFIYEEKDGILALTDYNNLVGSETDFAERNRRLRTQQKTQAEEKNEQIVEHNVYSDVYDNAPQNVPDSVQNMSIEIRDKILDIRDIDNRDTETEIKGDDKAVPQAETASPPPRISPCPFKKIMELYHQICVSYPHIKDIDGERKKAVVARWRKYENLGVFEQLFKIAQESSFMKGENVRNWHADFDWMMKPTNFSKILEHKYDDRKQDEKIGETDLHEFFDVAVNNVYNKYKKKENNSNER